MWLEHCRKNIVAKKCDHNSKLFYLFWGSVVYKLLIWFVHSRKKEKQTFNKKLFNHIHPKAWGK